MCDQAIGFAELVTDAEIDAALGVMRQLRPAYTTPAAMREAIKAQLPGGYRLVGGIVGGAVVVAAGYRVALTLSRGPHLFIDDLVTAEAMRGEGYGLAMLRHVASIAAKLNLPMIYLDSRAAARGFYERAGFEFHTSIPCFIETSKLLRE